MNVNFFDLLLFYQAKTSNIELLQHKIIFLKIGYPVFVYNTHKSDHTPKFILIQC